jgi:hypothetical protein
VRIGQVLFFKCQKKLSATAAGDFGCGISAVVL